MWNLLLDAATGGETGSTGGGTGANPMNGWSALILFFAIVAIFVLFMFLRSRGSKKEYQEAKEVLDSIRPGHKIKTTGGVCGIVVEVCDDNTVIIETGSDASGKSYMKIDKGYIENTDAKSPSMIAREEAEAKKRAAKEAKKGGHVQETPAETPQEAPKAESSETQSETKE